MKHHARLALFAAAVVALVSAAVFTAHSSAQQHADQVAPPAGPTVGQPAPDFTLNDQDGHAVALHSLRGKIVVLEWTNPTCPFVLRHYGKGTMKTEAARHPAAQVTWLAVDSTPDHTPASAQQWRATQHLPYPILLDGDSHVARQYAARTTPHMFVVDRAGVLRYMGAIDDDPRGTAAHARNYVGEAIDALLAGHNPPVASTEPYGCGVHYAH